MTDIKHYILATAGHVDHGKSSVVKKLTGVDPDRLPEEKSRGITIDLGFANIELQSGDTTYHVGIVDVPGHEDFVKNMVAGVGSIDIALLIVAADDGWMPQTEEHLQILSYLGVKRGVIAMTKADLVDNKEMAIAGIRKALAGSPLADAVIVPTSTVTGDGFEELKSALTTVLKETPLPGDVGKPRLNVDRVFKLKGIGTVVTGSLSGGQLRKNQGVILQPSGRKTRIRTLQSHSHEVDACQPGTRTAVNLADISVEQVKRGEIITLPDFGPAVDTVDVLIEKSARLADVKSPAANPLKDGARVQFHLGSDNCGARIYFAEREPLKPGDQRIAQIRMESRVFAFANDHFIIRDWSEQFTLAGGIVLDPEGHRRRFRGSKQQNFLLERATEPMDLSATILATLERGGLVAKSGLLLKTGFSREDISAASESLVSNGKVIDLSAHLALKDWWEQLRDKVTRTTEAFHKAHPEQTGCPLSEVRTAVAKELPVPEAFDTLMESLASAGYRVRGNAVMNSAHSLSLPPHLQKAGEQIRAALGEKPFEPPSRKELANDDLKQQALRFLRETGEVTELSAEIVLLTSVYHEMRDLVLKEIGSTGGATVSDFRKVIGTTRRIMVPLLEKLDSDGITRRDGDKRVSGRNA